MPVKVWFLRDWILIYSAFHFFAIKYSNFNDISGSGNFTNTLVKILTHFKKVCAGVCVCYTPYTPSFGTPLLTHPKICRYSWMKKWDQIWFTCFALGFYGLVVAFVTMTILLINFPTYILYFTLNFFIS